MKPKPFLRSLAISSSLIAAPLLHAQSTIVWDANAGTTGQTDGLGVWLAANQWWNGSTNTTWTSGDSAVFGNGGAGGAVTLASPTTVGSLNFNYFTGTYTVGSASQTITLNNGITKKAGSGIVAFAGPIVLGAAQTWTNNSVNAIQVTGTQTMNNGGFNLTIDGTGNTTFNPSGGNTLTLSGAGGIIKNGTGHLTLDGATAITHTFTGDIVVNGGSIGYQTASVLSGKNVKLTDGYLGARFSSNFTWTSGLGTGANQIQITGGTSGFSGEGGTSSSFQIGAALSTLTWGSTYFKPNVLLLNGDARMNASGKGSLNNGIDLNGSDRTITSLQTTDGVATSGFTVSGAIINGSGTAGLAKTGLGNLILTAANTYNGATTISSGALNTATTGGGSITLSGSGTLNSTSALNLNGTGTLRLVNTAQVNRLADLAAITSNGGTISYENTSGTNTYTETIGTLGLVKGQTNLLLSTDQVGTGSQTLTINTGGITRTGSSNTSSITFSAAGAGLNATKNRILVTGATATPANQIIGPWATAGTAINVQTKWAVYDASGYVVPDTIADTAEASWTNSTTNAWSLNPGANVSLTAARTAAALRFYGAAATLDLGNFNLSTNGIFFSGANAMVINSTGSGVIQTNSGPLYITAGQAVTHTITANITGASTGLVKSGAGTVILNGANYSFGGDIAVNAGTLQIGTGNPSISTTLGGGSYAGNIYINGGALLAIQGNATNILSGVISGDGNLNLMRGTTTLSGANTYTGKTTIGLVATNGTSNTVNVSSFNSVVGGSASSSLGAPTTIANGTIDFGASVQQTIQINYTGNGETTDRILNFIFNGTGTRIIDSSGGANALLKFTTAPTSNGTATSSVILQGSTNGELTGGLPFAFTNFTKSGNGTWTLGGAVGSTGLITVNAGTLALQKRVSLQGGLESNWTAAKINVKSAATLALNVDSADVNGLSANSLNTLLTNISVAGSATAGLQSGARLALDTSTATGGTFTQGNAIANSTGANGGAISLVKLGLGTLVLDKTNTYTGTTTVSKGVLAVNGSLANTTTTVASTATLQGSGSIGGSVTIQGGGTLAPGNSIESIATGSLTLLADAVYAQEIDKSAVPGVSGDLAVVTGTLNLALTNDSILTLTELGMSGTWAAGDKITLIGYSTGTWNGGLFKYLGGTLADDSTFTFSGMDWLFDYNDTTPGDNYTSDMSGFTGIARYVTMTAVPEPRAALLGGLGMFMLLRRRRD